MLSGLLITGIQFSVYTGCLQFWRLRFAKIQIESKNLCRRKCVRRAIFRNVEVRAPYFVCNMRAGVPVRPVRGHLTSHNKNEYEPYAKILLKNSLLSGALRTRSNYKENWYARTFPYEEGALQWYAKNFLKPCSHGTWLDKSCLKFDRSRTMGTQKFMVTRAGLTRFDHFRNLSVKLRNIKGMWLDRWRVWINLCSHNLW